MQDTMLVFFHAVGIILRRSIHQTNRNHDFIFSACYILDIKYQFRIYVNENIHQKLHLYPLST